MKDLTFVLLLCLVSFCSISQNAIYFYNSGNDKLDQKDFKGASEEYTKAIELNPNKPEFFMNRGIAKSELGDYRSAIEDFSVSITLDTNNKLAYFNRGNTHHMLRNYTGSVEDFDKVILIDTLFVPRICEQDECRNPSDLRILKVKN